MSKGINGLQNLGNTCYMNASLQCLRVITPLTEYIVERGGERHGDTTKNDLVDSYFSFVRDIWSCGNQILVPRDLKREFGRYKEQFLGYGQQDAPEFINFLLDAIHEAVKTVRTDRADRKKKVTESVISRLFYGQYRSTVTCDRCNHDSVTREPFMFLTLPVTRSLEDSFRSISRDDALTNDNRYKCDHCKSETNAVKRLEVERLPTVLIIYLKRFNGNRHRKVETNMDIPLQFDHSEGSYDLIGVVDHHGTLDRGHYTSSILIDGRWYDTDDQKIYEISKSQVVSKHAYILFYLKQ